MSCTTSENNFFSISTDLTVATCEEAWVFILLCVVNTIVIAVRNWCYTKMSQAQREMLLNVKKYNGTSIRSEWNRVFTYYMWITALAQFLRIVSILFILNANFWQLILITLVNILTSYVMFRYDVVKEDVRDAQAPLLSRVTTSSLFGGFY